MSLLFFTSIALAGPINDLSLTESMRDTNGVHASHQAQKLAASAPAIAPPSSPRTSPGVTVYGYIPNWISNPLSVDFGSMTHVAWFDVGLDDDGTLEDTASWNGIAADLVAVAHAQDTKVHLCITSFYDSEHAAVLSDPAKRAVLVSELAAAVNAYGADGVNVDFEGLDNEWKEEFVSLIEALSDEVDEVYIATPAIDWNGSYDYDALSAASDGLFIMGYDYHWGGGDPGPVAPLTGGLPWSDYALDWTLEDYREWGAPDDKIVMGLPLYGHEWPSDSDAVPGTSTGTASSQTLTGSVEMAAIHGARYDDVTSTPWLWTGSSQLWYDDIDSVALRIEWAVSEEIQGIGFWAVGYEGGDPAFWSMVNELTAFEVIEDTGSPEDTAPPDTGDSSDADDPPPTSSEDSGKAVAEWQPRVEEEETEPKGCGCSGVPGPSGMLWWMSGLVLMARRRRA